MKILGALVELILHFSIASFVCWCFEAIYKSIKEKRFVNPGFLYGPFLPIYGFASVTIYYINLSLSKVPFILKLPIWFMLATFIEYITSFILEKIFSTKLWDYSNEKFNFHGRVCLKFSIYWTILCLFALYIAQPIAFSLLKKVDEKIKYFFAGTMLAYFIIDSFFSAKLYSGIMEFIKYSKEWTFSFGENIKKLPFYIRKMIRPFTSFPNLLKKFLFNSERLPESLTEEIKKQVYGKKDRG